MKKVMGFTLVSVILMLLVYCDKDVTSPEKLVPGSRNYTWELDTLDMPMNYISSVWGASPTDVWAVGGAGIYYERLQHYDGNHWTAYKKEAINIGGEALFGFAANDVWMGGQAGWGHHGAALWHYDGAAWSQNFVYDPEGCYTAYVVDLWGTGPSDLYASGVISFYDGKNDDFRGFLLHYDGERWKEVVRGLFDSQFLRVRKDQYDNIYVLSISIGLAEGSGEIVILYKVNEEKLKEIYIAPRAQIFWASFEIIEGNGYFVIGENVYLYRNGELLKQFSYADPEFYCSVSGRDGADIFLPTGKGIAHYNGSDIKYLFIYPNERMGNVNRPMIFQEDIFYCISNSHGSAGSKNLVLHGRLKE